MSLSSNWVCLYFKAFSVVLFCHIRAIWAHINVIHIIYAIMLIEHNKIEYIDMYISLTMSAITYICLHYFYYTDSAKNVYTF